MHYFFKNLFLHIWLPHTFSYAASAICAIPRAPKQWHAEESSHIIYHECLAKCRAKVNICSHSPTMVTSPCEWKIVKWDKKPHTNKNKPLPFTDNNSIFHVFSEISVDSQMIFMCCPALAAIPYLLISHLFNFNFIKQKNKNISGEKLCPIFCFHI